MRRILQLVVATAATLTLLGCAHPINMNPDLATVNPAGAPINRTVGLRITEASKTIEVTTPAGGGDKVRYFPYKDIEPGLYKVVSDTFRETSMIRTDSDLSKLQNSPSALVLTPEITTESASDSVVTWPPTQFTVNLNCRITDLAGKEVDTVRVSGYGRATFDEFKSNFSLAAVRASTDALNRLSQALRDSAKLRN